jgi:hypothetical protein
MFPNICAAIWTQGLVVFVRELPVVRFMLGE